MSDDERPHAQHAAAEPSPAEQAQQRRAAARAAAAERARRRMQADASRQQQRSDAGHAQPLTAQAPSDAPSSVIAPAEAHTLEQETKPILQVDRLTKRFGDTVAVDGISFLVTPGQFFGIVGPNGAGKTTTLSMLTGLLRPDEGDVHVHGVDVWASPGDAKRRMGVLPDNLRLFDRLTGRQLLFHSAVLRGLDRATARERSEELLETFELVDAADRLVADYSIGMQKKVALASALIHAPRILVLDEPFEAVDPVSTATLLGMLRDYVGRGGTVVLSSHSMQLVERVCDHVAVIVDGRVLALGPTDQVRAGRSLEERFLQLVGRSGPKGMAWLRAFSD